MTKFKSQQRGMTLIEVIVAISIGLILMALVASGFSMYQTYQTNSITAEWLKTWQAGAQQWINDNSASLVASGGGTATQATLNAAGYFGPGFAAQNSYGETGTLKVVVGPGGRLDGLVCAAGGVAPTGLQQRQIAGMVGIAGGWVASTAPTIAVGKGWGPVNLSTYGIPSGGCQLVVALFVANLASTDDALHRHATPGQPQLNQMSTAIDMNGNDLNTVRTLNLPYGGNAINIGGSLIYGDSSNIALRPAGGGVYLQTPSGGSANIFQVHNINGDATSTFTAQYMSATTGLWSGSYVNTNGSMLAGGNINSNSSIAAAGDITAGGAVFANNWLRTYGATGWYSQTYGGGWYMSDPSWVRSYGDKNVYTGGQMQAGSIQSNGALTAAGRITGQEFVQINGVANMGWGCSPNGLVARAADGTLLSCVSGTWQGGGGYTQFQIVQGPGTNGMNNSLATCPAGWTMLSGGARIASNPYSFLPGYQSYPASATTWVAYTTDTKVWVVAYAFCAK